jgi:hypothetical protein
MQIEFNSLIENQIWDLIKRFDIKQNVIIDRRTFRLKRDRNDNFQRYEVRWVTHDFKQRHEIDFDEIFVLIVKLVSYKALIIISIIRELQIRHINVVIAFLYELLDEDVYVIQFHMFKFEENEDDTFVCKLTKALYDRKQTSKMWYDIIHKFLIDLRFKRSNSDHAVFIKNEIFLIMYVNDLLLFDLNLNNLYEIQKKLKQRFKMTNLRQLSHYLDMKIIINSDRDQLMLIQSIYLKKILKQFEMNQFKLVSILMKSKMINSLMSTANKTDHVTTKWWQQLIESLMWSAMHTRLDLAYSVRVLSRYAHNLSSTHCALVKRKLKYVAETINVDLIFERSNDQHSDDLIDYNDSNFVELKDKRHSTKDYVFILVEETISYSSKPQFIIVLSSCEIEYMILSKTAKEAIWIKEFLRSLEFRSRDNQFVLILADNKSAIDLIINSLYHKRTKHIEMRWHWIRKMMNRKKIILRYLLINEMIADELIKSLSVSAFSKFRIMLNLSSWLIETS